MDGRNRTGGGKEQWRGRLREIFAAGGRHREARRLVLFKRPRRREDSHPAALIEDIAVLPQTGAGRVRICRCGRRKRWVSVERFAVRVRSERQLQRVCRWVTRGKSAVDSNINETGRQWKGLWGAPVFVEPALRA